VPLKDVHDWEQGFLKFVREERKQLWQKITDTKQLDDSSAAEVEAAIAEFQKRFAVQAGKATVTV